MNEPSPGSLWYDGDGNDAEILECDRGAVAFVYSDALAGPPQYLTLSAFLCEFMPRASYVVG